jgi:hypothetical protein
MIRSTRLLGAATILAALALSFGLSQYHAARQLACDAYARGSDRVAFVHPCLDARETRWATWATVAVLFAGLWIGTRLVGLRSRR